MKIGIKYIYLSKKIDMGPKCMDIAPSLIVKLSRFVKISGAKYQNNSLIE